MAKHLQRKSSQSGFTILEVVLGMTILLMMAMIYGAVVPVALRETQQGGNYNEAALIAQHKMDELRTTNFINLGSPSQLIASGLVDAQNVDGSYDFSTTTADNLAAYFPTGTTGTIVLAADTSTGTMSGSVYDATITITWPNSASHAGTFTLKNKIINY